MTTGLFGLTFFVFIGTILWTAKLFGVEISEERLERIGGIFMLFLMCAPFVLIFLGVIIRVFDDPFGWLPHPR
jgi:uncharacterized membrane protein YqjE